MKSACYGISVTSNQNLQYPAAPDRSDNYDDTPDFTLLMQTLRETFDRSGLDLGLTFTIPASFYYLRWFDMPGLMKYASWTNLMSYDMHGEWDQQSRSSFYRRFRAAHSQ